MSKIHGRNARVYLNGQDISNFFNSADLSQPIDTTETTGFGDTDKSVVVGLRGGAVKLAGYYDSASGTASVDAIFNTVEQASVDPILTVLTAPNIDDKGVSASMALTGRQVSAPIAGVVSVTADFLESTTLGLDRVRTVQAKGTLTPSVAGGTTSAWNGGTATLQGAVGYMQAFAVAAGTPVVVIEHSADGSTSWAALITFAAMNGTGAAPQAQKASVSGTVQPFQRTTVTGGSAVVWTGINQPIA